jgi:hypothetical protein
VFDKAQRCTDDLLALYGFRQGDADEAPLQAIEGRWTLDFFSPEAMKDAGLRLGKGAVIGAAVGVVADLAVAGISLGAGAALGGAIGGAVSQGWGPLGRKLANKLRDVHEVTVEDGVLFTLVAWQLKLTQALEQRGHAATQRIAPRHPRTAMRPRAPQPPRCAARSPRATTPSGNRAVLRRAASGAPRRSAKRWWPICRAPCSRPSSPDAALGLQPALAGSYAPAAANGPAFRRCSPAHRKETPWPSNASSCPPR